MITTALLLFVVAALAALGLYGLGFVLVAALGVTGRPPPDESPPPEKNRRTLVLIPSHHEGTALIDTVQSLLDQDEPGFIEARVLVADESDDSVAALRGHFRQTGNVLHDDARRAVRIVATGFTAKREKLNQQLAAADADYVAFLDADHRAGSGWISSAIARLRSSGAGAVQSRRRPLSTLRLVQLWDSTQNHVGNELVNRVLGRLGRSVAFTGTTALFAAHTLRERRFSQCVTEDTWLTFDLACAGERIAYDGSAGSYEEVAPSLASFVARRRRWSAGHTRSFAAHFFSLLRSPAPLQLLYYGVFYLVPLLVALSLLAQAAYLLLQLPRDLLALDGALTLTAAAFLERRCHPWRRLRLGDWLVTGAWVLPFATWTLVFLFRLGRSETSYHLLSFPFAEKLIYAQLAALALPLLPIGAGWLRLGGAHPMQIILFILTYPIMVFFDLYAGLLGTWDLLCGRSEWSRVERSNIVALGAVPEALRGRMQTAVSQRPRFYALLWLLPAAALIVLGNDVLSVNECGVIRPFLWKPLVIRRRHPLDFRVTVDKRLHGADDLSLRISARAAGALGHGARLFYSLDGKALAEEPFNGAAEREQTLPLGWREHTVEVRLQDAQISCRRVEHFSTVVKETVGPDLRLNGEPFLVKGVVASYASPQLNLDSDRALAQMKEMGANAVRIYHRPGGELLQAAARQQILLLDQPDDSTWQNVNVSRVSAREDLVGRYRELLESTAGYPFILMHNLGNELELELQTDAGIAAVRRLVDAVRPYAEFPLTYSTYYTFTDYRIDIRGVNMLDTGETYWTGALGLMRDLGMPFYATELGGFVALYEVVSPELRSLRLRDEWSRLLTAGAMGGFVYESHDNWAQSLPPGSYNDPLSPEQPDDTRGLWDHLNQPKLEQRFVTQLFSDVEVTNREAEGGALELHVRNRRRYRLSGVELSEAGGARQPLGDLAPGAELTAKLPLLHDRLRLAFSYTTHHGLAARSWVEQPAARRGDRPVVLNSDFVADGDADGHLIDSNIVEILAPAGARELLVNGRREPVVDGVVRAAVRPPLRPVLDAEVSRDGAHWEPVSSAAGGRYILRFRLPPGTSRRALLLMSGVGAPQAVLLSAPRRIPIPLHNYRQNPISLAILGDAPLDQPIAFGIDRQQIYYLPPDNPIVKRSVAVALEVPQVYEPTAVEIRLP